MPSGCAARRDRQALVPGPRAAHGRRRAAPPPPRARGACTSAPAHRRTASAPRTPTLTCSTSPRRDNETAALARARHVRAGASTAPGTAPRPPSNSPAAGSACSASRKRRSVRSIQRRFSSTSGGTWRSAIRSGSTTSTPAGVHHDPRVAGARGPAHRVGDLVHGGRGYEARQDDHLDHAAVDRPRPSPPRTTRTPSRGRRSPTRSPPAWPSGRPAPPCAAPARRLLARHAAQGGELIRHPALVHAHNPVSTPPGATCVHAHALCPRRRRRNPRDRDSSAAFATE